MRKIILAALAATLVLSLAAGTATARRGLRPGTTHFFIRFNPLEFTSNLGNVTRCPVILDVTLHETIAKVEGTLAGYTRISILEASCTGTSMGLLGANLERIGGLTTTYHVQYVTFSGELPNITSVTLKIVGIRFWLEFLGNVCLAAPASIKGITTGGNPITGIRPESESVPLTALRGFSCLATSLRFSGTGNLVTTLLGETATSSAITLV